MDVADAAAEGAVGGVKVEPVGLSFEAVGEAELGADDVENVDVDAVNA